MWCEHKTDPAIKRLAATWKLHKPKSTSKKKFKSGHTHGGPTRLSKLYRRAHVVNAWFQRAVEGWQRDCNSADEYTPIGIKHPDRAIEKIRRTYFGVVSRLTDAVRASIVVNSIDEVDNILKIIANDKSVTIVRGKNRFDPTYPVSDSGGYRDFQLLLRCSGVVVPAQFEDDLRFVADCQETCAEVQIHVKDILQFKNSRGHEGYTRFRKIMAK
jgi:ppGpp synthetase/RelA/SpoT-type nucleotidyltranferase